MWASFLIVQTWFKHYPELPRSEFLLDTHSDNSDIRHQGRIHPLYLRSYQTVEGDHPLRLRAVRYYIMYIPKIPIYVRMLRM